MDVRASRRRLRIDKAKIARQRNPLPKNGDSVNALWLAYERDRGDVDLRNRIVEHYLPWANGIAKQLAMNMPVEIDDLVSYSRFGLIEAVERYQLSKGVLFTTFATVRLRGAMLDSLRQVDPITRKFRARQKSGECICRELEQKLGRRPTTQEAEDAMGGFRALMDSLPPATKSLFSELDDPKKGGDAQSLCDVVPCPVKKLGDGGLFRRLTAGVDFEKKMMLWLYFVKGHTMREVGNVMLLAESRISHAIKEAKSIMAGNLARLTPEQREKILDEIS